MKRLKYGIVGAGFVGPHHIDAVRRLGFVDIAALAASNLELARRKAAQLFVPRAYGSYQELVADPEIDVVDIATPTWLHHRIALAAVAARKHVIVDKPMAATAAEARKMMKAAREAGVVNAVTFNYRYNPVVQHARVMIRRGDAGEIRFVHGHYTQDWLLHETDYSWRLERDKAGPACVVGDAGAHWFDLAQYLTGLRVASVLADLTTAIKTRKRPVEGRRETFAENPGGRTEDFSVEVDDLSSVLLRFENGAAGNFFGCQLCAGHKNDLHIEINGSRCLARVEAGATGRVVDRPARRLERDAAQGSGSFGSLRSALRRAARRTQRGLAGRFPEPHAERAHVHCRRARPGICGGDLFPTFETGYRVAAIVDAVVRSQEQGSRWVEVQYQ